MPEPRLPSRSECRYCNGKGERILRIPKQDPIPVLCGCMLPVLREFQAFVANERMARDSAFHETSRQP